MIVTGGLCTPVTEYKWCMTSGGNMALVVLGSVFSFITLIILCFIIVINCTASLRNEKRANFMASISGDMIDDDESSEESEESEQEKKDKDIEA